MTLQRSRATTADVASLLVRALFALFLAIAIAASEARAGTVLGVDVQNYIIMYEGGGANQLSINNFGTTQIWSGDIGIAGTGKLAASGPGTVNGNINFFAANTGQSSITNTTVTGTVNFNVNNAVTGVQAVMNNLNSLSASLGALASQGTALAINTSSDQTVLATAGAAKVINGVAYSLFNVSGVQSNNGENLIIKGDGSSSVVLDVGANANFHGNILLQDLNGKFFGDPGYAGLSPDQLIINGYGGNSATLTGGPTIDVNNGGDAAHPNNIVYGVFLDPNGTFSMTHTRFIGRDFGGDTQNMQIVSGDTITLPPTPPTIIPEPSSLVIQASLAAVIGCVALVRRKRRQAA